MLALAIAARFLRSAPGQTALIIGGIGVGIAVQIFVGSLITSLQDDLVDSTVGSSPHVTVTTDDNGPVPADLADDANAEPEVVAAIAVRQLSVIYAAEDDTAPLSVTAGDAEDLDSIYDLQDRVIDGDYRLDDHDVLIGRTFAEDRDLAVGDPVPVVLPDGSNDDYQVAGILDLGQAAANERFAFIGAASAAQALGLADDEFTAIEIQVGDVFTSTDVADRLTDDGLEVVDWQAQNEELLSGLAAQSGSSFMIQAFVLVAVALGIASTLAISAVQKTRQIGILKAMGMTDGAAGRIFLLQAAILGVAGVIVGIGLGYLLIWGFSFAPVDFSVRPSPTLIAISALIGIAVAMISSIIPSRSTSRVDPIEVIQGG